jgi:hypothetical protein
MVGRLLRAQAACKQMFARVLPLLSAGFIRPTTETRPAGKERKAIAAAIDGAIDGAIAAAITALQRNMAEDDTSFVALQNVIEQCCTSFLQHERFPTT